MYFLSLLLVLHETSGVKGREQDLQLEGLGFKSLHGLAMSRCTSDGKKVSDVYEHLQQGKG